MYRPRPPRLRSVGCRMPRRGKSGAPAVSRRGFRKLLSRVKSGLQARSAARRRGARGSENAHSFNDMDRNGAPVRRWRPGRADARERPILTVLLAINTVIASNTGSRQAAPRAL